MSLTRRPANRRHRRRQIHPDEGGFRLLLWSGLPVRPSEPQIPDVKSPTDRLSLASRPFAATTFILAAGLCLLPLTSEGQASSPPSWTDLTKLFDEWRVFERPALREGAPDYTAAAMARKHAELRNWQARLQAIDTTSWSPWKRMAWRS